MTTDAAGPALPKGFPRIHVLDTGVASRNVGDEVIMEATVEQMAPALAGAYVTTSPSHDAMGPVGRAHAAAADTVMLFGSNALNPKFHLGRADIWRIGWRDLGALRGKVVLVGVGGRRDYDRMSPRQRWLLRHILSRRHVHSVRDEVGKRILTEAGLEGLNTSCSTLWRWRDSQPAAPTGKAAQAVFTLTRHKRAAEDREMIRILGERYERLWFWPQQIEDLDYLRDLDAPVTPEVIPPNLAAYDRFLRDTAVDYVGTRLHGGIKALSRGRRAIVVEIDNRARDIGADTGLPTVTRPALPQTLPGMVDGAFETTLTLPCDRIERFLGQFTSATISKA